MVGAGTFRGPPKWPGQDRKGANRFSFWRKRKSAFKKGPGKIPKRAKRPETPREGLGASNCGSPGAPDRAEPGQKRRIVPPKKILAPTGGPLLGGKRKMGAQP